MNTQLALRVMILAHQPIFRRGLVTILHSMTECEIIGQPTQVGEVLELVRSCQPEIALLDTLSETVDILEVAQHLRTFSPHTAIIILSEKEGEEWLFQAMKVGAAAYLTRNVTPDDLLGVVRRVSQGEYLINETVLSQPALARRVLQTFRDLSTTVEDDPRSLEACPLSNREVDILEHMSEGMSNKEIARLLSISDQTVKNHITSILRKLHVNDRTAAVVFALKQHWIHVP
jgi:DNA-binding NarL/FixJ family response regulator